MPFFFPGFQDQSGGSGAPGTPVDSDFDSVTLLVAADTLLVDQSKYGQVANPFGTVDSVPTESGGYIVLNGSNQFLSWADVAEFDFGSGDFTVEIFGLQFDSNVACTIIGQVEPATVTQAWNIYRRLSPARWIIVRNLSGSAGGSTTDLTVNETLSTGTDYDICFERSGDTWRLYRDGVMIGSDTQSGTVFDTNTALRLGARYTGSAYDDFAPIRFKAARITNGVARYGSDSGYSVPALPLLTGATGLAGERVVPGVWSWFADKRAITYSSKLAVQSVQRDGADGHLHAFEGVSPYGRGDFTRTILKASIDNDDHALGSFLRRLSDGKILAAYAGHSSSDLWTRLSSSADSIASMAAETGLDATFGFDEYTYPSLVQLDGEINDPIYMFFRAKPAGDRTFYYSTSTDGGATWASATALLSNSGGSTWPPYVRWVQNGNDRIDFVTCDGSPNDNTTNSVYHFYWYNGSFRKTDGTALTLPIVPSTDLTKVYDGTTNRAWIWDIVLDASSQPVIGYTAYPSTTDHRYRRAGWNGSSWDDEEIVAGGTYLFAAQPYYSGGLAIDPDDVDQVWVSRHTGSGVHQLWRYNKVGSSWDGTQLTTNAHPSFRPVVVRGASRLLYLNGAYTTFEDFYTHVCSVAI